LVKPSKKGPSTQLGGINGVQAAAQIVVDHPVVRGGKLSYRQFDRTNATHNHLAREPYT